MIGYKIVNRTILNIKESMFFRMFSSVVYKPGEWVIPRKNCGPLCVFGSEAAAQMFLTKQEMQFGVPTWEIWEVEYNPTEADHIWDYFTNEVFAPELPPATILAEAVRLTKKL